MARKRRSIAVVLRMARRRLRLTQTQMAERSGYTQASLSLIESGKRLPRGRLRALAKAYGISIDQLVP